jgi:nitric oxide dioxygenase
MMLSSESHAYIQASVPVLKQHGLTITQRFYHSMLSAHPELRNVFNMGNQANGVQQQSLAAAVFAYASNIHNAEALGPVVRRIAHKHAAVGIRPEHYPIVGRHLLQAISDTLGAAATPALIQAWDEAYWLLAGELIAAEARLYQTHGDFRSVTVMRVQPETEQIVSLYLTDHNQQSPGRFLPGQYISVEALFDEVPQRQLRQYSLCDAVDKPWWRIAIKREDAPAGRVSHWLHTHVHEQQQLQVSAPFGDFTPALDEEQAPLVLISAGIGITPMLSMLKTLADRQSVRPVWLVHAARSRQHLAFSAELVQTQAQLTHLNVVLFYDDETGPMRFSGLSLPSNAQYWLCGPHVFMQAQREALLSMGVGLQQIHREVFGPELLD